MASKTAMTGVFGNRNLVMTVTQFDHLASTESKNGLVAYFHL
jgi:hypothetical protein